MQQTRSLQSAYIFPVIIFMISAVLVFLFPNKPPKVLDVSFFQSSVNPVVTVTFSEAMAESTLTEGGLVFEPPLDGDFSWSGNTLFFTPQEHPNFDTNYSLQIKPTVKSREGEPLGELFSYERRTSPRKLIYLTEEGQLFSYDLFAEQEELLSDLELEVLDFDYDWTSGQLVVLALGAGDKIPAVYLINPEKAKIKKLKKISVPDYQVHFVKWLPFENAVMLSRTRIQFLNKDGSVNTLSTLAEDRELVKYEFDNDQVRQIATGNALILEFYPSPDGYKVSYINDQGAYILKDVDLGVEMVIATDFYDYLGFSDFGNYAVYLTKEDYSTFILESNVVLQDTDGGKEVVTVEELDSLVVDAMISPNEEFLALVVADAFGGYQLARADIENGEVDFLTADLGKIDDLEFSPDGRYLGFTVEDANETPYLALFDLVDGEIEWLGLVTGKFQWQY